ncbi:MAG: nucleotidyltransferase domain-containing protein [Candidatus Electrothrix sp. AUS1_2]|nr:nucleotidyltransferase domain-containing protein [Candidatus Electrothrix sp. AUS1_2]
MQQRVHGKLFRKDKGAVQSVEIPDSVRDIIERYIAALQENNVPINQAVLFGSYAKGNYHEWSDIDIALVSDIFEGNRFDDKGKIRNINLSVSCDLEILPYRPEDFTVDDPFVKEILRTGVKLI